MAIDILMPALSPTMTEGKLASWLKKEGDSVESGEVIAEIETDKATMEIEAIDDGILGKILVAAGSENVAVNSKIAVLLEEGDDASAIEPVSNGSSIENNTATSTPEVAANNSSSTVDVPKQNTVQAEDESLYKNTQTITVREALRDAMAEEMRKDDTVFVMGEEVAEYQGAYKVTQGLLDEFGPKRVIDTPITEHGFAGLGVGAAFGGLKPIIEFMTMNFAMQAIDHIINSAAKTHYMSGGQMKCPIVFRGPNGAASRVGAQHSQCYASWYGHVPGLKVIAPYSAADAKGLLKAAIQDPNPVVFLENELLYGQSFEIPTADDFIIPIGKDKIVRSGSDVTLVGYGMSVQIALDAAELLAKEGIEAEIVDLRTIRPIDKEMIVESLKKTNRLVSIEESWPFAGIGSEIAMIAMEDGFDYLDAPVERVCSLDVPLPYAANLEKAVLPNATRVVDAVKKVCYVNQ